MSCLLVVGKIKRFVDVILFQYLFHLNNIIYLIASLGIHVNNNCIDIQVEQFSDKVRFQFLW